MKKSGFIPNKKYISWDEVPVIFDAPIAAVLLGENIRTIQYKAQKGTIPAFKVGKVWRFRKEDIQEIGVEERCSES